MIVKVRTIVAPYQDVPTESLQAILRNHADNRLHVRIGIRQLYDIMGELARRREASGTPFRSNEEALADLRARLVQDDYDPTIPHDLTPSPAGRECLGNGTWPGYECQCDECPHFLTCFPE